MSHHHAGHVASKVMEIRMKTFISAFTLSLGLLFSPHVLADAKAACEKSAADKKLAGAAKDGHIKKCVADTQAACEKAAADKKLAGAAKDGHIKKCVAEGPKG